LRHPLWQRKRLEILKRADFRCEDCGSEEKTLHTHHRFYLRGREPWEYEDEAFLCLCQDCHAAEEERLEQARHAWAMCGWSTAQQLGFARAIRAWDLQYDGFDACKNRRVAVANREEAAGVAEAYSTIMPSSVIMADGVIAVLTAGSVSFIELHTAARRENDEQRQWTSRWEMKRFVAHVIGRPQRFEREPLV
jgi:hypothetical protein